MKNWNVDLAVGGKTLAEVKILGGIFQEDALSPLLFVIAMMPLNYILKKGSWGYKFIKSTETINPTCKWTTSSW